MLNSKTKIVLLIVAVELLCSLAYGQDIKGPDDKWKLNVMPYLWLLDVQGQIEINGHKGNAHVNSANIYDALEVGGMANIELRKEKWGLFVNPTYMKLSPSKDLIILLPDTGGVPVTPTTKIGITATVIEFGGFYEIGHWSPPWGQSKRKITLDALAGARYWDIEQKLSFASLSSKVHENLIDPLIGARLKIPVNHWLLLNVTGDVGGFSISSQASNSTYNLFIGPQIKLSDSIDLLGGYRWYNFDRTKSSDTNSDISFSGPLLGLQIRF